MEWANAPGNVELAASLTGLPKDSVANVSQILTINRETLTNRAGKLPHNVFKLIIGGISIVLGQ
jgi:mRNA interferase MazF